MATQFLTITEENELQWTEVDRKAQNALLKAVVTYKKEGTMQAKSTQISADERVPRWPSPNLPKEKRSTNIEVISTANDYFSSLDKIHHTKGIKCLEKCWTKCIKGGTWFRTPKIADIRHSFLGCLTYEMF